MEQPAAGRNRSGCYLSRRVRGSQRVRFFAKMVFVLVLTVAFQAATAQNRAG